MILSSSSSANPGTPLAVWVGFHLALLVLLAAELGFARVGLARLPPEARERRRHHTAIAASVMWLCAALGLAVYIHQTFPGNAAIQFFAGYALEETLSIDNLFLFLLLFRLFQIPPAGQPRVLFWGVLGAILMRGAFIAAGISLLTRFAWVGYAFALVLLFAAIRLVLPGKPEDAEAAPATPIWIGWLSRIHPVSLRTDRFFTREDGRAVITMLFLSVIAIELTDVIFALDSIPAVLAITRDPFLAYTSNILAVMSLRSLFVLLAAALQQLRFLHFGLAAILAFAALKMLSASIVEIGPLTSLAVILAILALTVLFSLAFRRPQ